MAETMKSYLSWHMQSSFAHPACYARASMSADAASNVCIATDDTTRNKKSTDDFWCTHCGVFIPLICIRSDFRTVFRYQAWFRPMVGLPVSAIVYLLLTISLKKEHSFRLQPFMCIASKCWYFKIPLVGTAPADADVALKVLTATTG